jgi:hypothetical protein
MKAQQYAEPVIVHLVGIGCFVRCLETAGVTLGRKGDRGRERRSPEVETAVVEARGGERKEGRKEARGVAVLGTFGELRRGKP